MIKYVKLLIILLLFSSAIFSQTPTLQIDKVTGTGTLHVPVSVTGTLDNVKSISLQIQYDPNSITFQHVISADTTERLSGLSNISGLLFKKYLSVSSSGGLITISWINTKTTGVGLSGTLFDLDFDYNSDFSEVKIIYAGIKNMAGAKLTCNFVNGSIAPNTNPVIMVKYPTGGENLEVTGTPTPIQWTSVYVNHVNIQYSSDDGSTWNDVINNLDAALNSYNWTIPSGVNSSNCKIKISDADAADPLSAANDVSNSFIIDSAPTLTIVSPNGGEVLVTGGVKNISWTSKNVTNVKLEYTLDNGATWTTIVSNITASAASYDWDIPNTTSGNCKIKITDLSSTSTANDLSNATFSIVDPPVSVVVTKKEQANLVKIGKLFGWYEYSPYLDENNPPDYSWNITFNTTYEANGETYSVPDTLVVDGQVPVNIGCWITNLTYFEMELSFDDNVLQFDSVSNIPSVMRPLSASVEGNIIHIIWSGDKPIDIHDKIFELSFTYKKLNKPDLWIDWSSFNSSISPKTNQIPLDPRNYSGIKIKKVTARDSKGSIINTNAWTNGSLCVNDYPFIKLLYPVGGEVLEYNDSPAKIKWVSRGVTSMVLNYIVDSHYINVLPSSIISSDGSVHEDSTSWNLPSGVNSTNCKIYLTGNAGVFPFQPATDISYRYFSITNYDSLVLGSPEAGDILRVGSQKIIKWRSRNIANVKLEYTTSYDPTADPTTIVWKEIAGSVNAKNYSYTWTVPNESSSNCRIRISNAANDTELDYGSGDFEITSSNVTVSLPTLTSAPAGEITVPVTVDQVNSITYINFSITYNTAHMTLDYVESSGALSGGYLGYSTDNNIVRIVWISSTPVDVTGTLFVIHFKNFDGTGTPLNFDTNGPNVIKDLNGNVIPIELVNGFTDVKSNSIPKTFALYQNYPNPFNPSTSIRFELPKSSRVNIAIFNTLGQKVATLVDEYKNAGAYEIKWNANSCASGIYFYLIRAGEFVLTKKMILLK